jgi:hypothetical protein
MRKTPAALNGLKVTNSAATRFLTLVSRSGLASRGYVAYAVLDERASDASERREQARRHSRLQSGKLIDGNGRFLVECVFRDRSGAGVRLKLAGAVPLPRKIQLFDDQLGSLCAAEVIWRRGVEIGCKLAPTSIALNDKLLRRLRQPHYAVR